MSEKLLTRTQGGERAWRSLPLPPPERRMLGLVRAPLPEHAVKVLIGQDPLLSVMLGRGWLKWEEERKDDLSPLPQLPIAPSSQEGSEALKRIHDRMEEKRKMEEQFAEKEKQDMLEQGEDGENVLPAPSFSDDEEKESDLLISTPAELDTYSSLPSNTPLQKQEIEEIVEPAPSPLSLKVQQWIEEEPAMPKESREEKDAKPSPVYPEVSQEEKEESLKRFMAMMSMSPKQ